MAEIITLGVLIFVFAVTAMFFWGLAKLNDIVFPPFGLVTTIAMILMVLSLTIVSVETYQEMKQGACQQGLGPGTYQAQIVGTESHGEKDFYRLIVAGTDENNSTELESQCRLIPAVAFRTPPTVTLEFQTINVIAQGDFRIVTVSPSTR